MIFFTNIFRIWAVAGLSAISFESRLCQAFKRMSLLSLLLLFWVCKLSAQQIPFPLTDVSLKSSVFKNAQDVDLQYILALNPDKLLAPYLIDAGLKQKAPRYGNWESAGLDGHIAGHYLSALSMMYASTKNKELKSRLNYMISELSRCQTANKNGYVGGIPQGKVFWDRIHNGDIDGRSFGLNNTWVPLYNIHKLFAGLIDAYTIGKNQQAKIVLIALSNWFYNLLQPLSNDQIQLVLKTEHGGINEAFADIYTLTKDPRFLDLAIKLSHQALLKPLLNNQDLLTGLHANTQIPKVIGFEKISRISSNKQWSNAADFFWNTVSQNRSVAFGGNSVREHFNPSNDFSSMIESNQGPETCNSYNMLKLSKALYLNSGNSKYLEYYEKTLYNHILSSQHPQKGGFVYFTPIRPNHYRVYSQVNTSMWCCVGSGIENHSKYGELIYTHTENDLFVNLFIPSVLNWKQKGLVINQFSSFPFENKSILKLSIDKPKEFSINLRIPTWAHSFELFINSQKTAIPLSENGFVKLNRIWKTGDKIEFRFIMKTRFEYLPDNSKYGAFLHGPIVLAAKTDSLNLDGLFANDSRMGHEATGPLVPIYNSKTLLEDSIEVASKLKIVNPKKLKFALDNIELMPFFEIHESRYQMYFQTLSQSALDSIRAVSKQIVTSKQTLEMSTIDKINCGEQQPEVDHKYIGQKSESGYHEGRFWRNTSSYISYQLFDKFQLASYLDIEFLDKVDVDKLKFSINNVIIEPEILENNRIRLSFKKSEFWQFKMETQNGIYSPRIHQIRLRKQ